MGERWPALANPLQWTLMLRRALFRLAAVLFGLAGTFLVLEAALQTAAAALDRAGRRESHVPVDGEVRIACVGESTTYGMWPGQLEEILNRGQSGRDIRVINRGLVGIRTDGVAREIEGWLDEDRPHLVITMLGINDEGNLLVYRRGGARPWVVEHVRTFRLLGLLWRSAFDIGVPEEPGGEAPHAEAHLDSEIRSVLERLQGRRPEATRRFRYSEMIAIQHELITADPGTPVYHLGYLKGLVLYHDTPERLDEFFINETGVEPSELGNEERRREIASWAERTGDRFTGFRLAVSIARLADDPDSERRLLEKATGDPDLAGLAWLRWADFAARSHRHELVRQYLLRADNVLPDDYQWSLLLGDISFRVEAYDLAAEHFRRALLLRPDLPASHELVVLGRLANACEQSGEVARAAGLRARRDELELGRFREFTRFYYQRVVDAVRAREIPVIAMQYPLLSAESLRKLLDYREDVTYLENRTNFEAPLLDVGYRALFDDLFAGSFGHLTDRGNMLVAENVVEALAEVMPELGLRGGATQTVAEELP